MTGGATHLLVLHLTYERHRYDDIKLSVTYDRYNSGDPIILRTYGIIHY